jgi:hypothetical protein
MKKKWYGVRVCFFVALVVTLLFGAEWTVNVEENSENGEDFNSLAYGNGIHIAVGNSGWAHSSTDGENWVPLFLYPEDTPEYDMASLQDVIRTGSHFVAVGSRSTVFTSQDGLEWTNMSDNISTDDVYFRAVAYNQERFTAVGMSAADERIPEIYTSEDGISWEPLESLPAGEYTEINDVMWDADLSQFVAVGDNGGVLTSSDGLEWEYTTTPSAATHFAVIRAHGMYIVGGGLDGDASVYTSANGAEWEMREVPRLDGYFSSPIRGLISVEGEIHGFSYYSFMSEDGITWTISDDIDGASGGWRFNAALHNGERIIIAGEASMVMSTQKLVGSIESGENTVGSEDFVRINTISRAEQLHITYDLAAPVQHLSVQIFTPTGKSVHRKNYHGVQQGTQEVVVNALSPGTYILRMDDGTLHMSVPLVMHSL